MALSDPKTKTPKTKRLVAAALAGAMVAAPLTMLAPAAALAVPPGGYGDLVETVSPSVVLIEVTGKAEAQAGERDKQMEEFQRRFGELFPVPPAQNGPSHGLGSGFIISTDGQIVTNNHVIEGADSVMVTLADGKKLEATVIGRDPLTDIALLKVEAGKDLPALRFGLSAQMRPGDEVVAVGNPYGLGGTVTSGIISAMSRNIQSGPYDDFIQTDAAINRGNSGGPLFNNEGEVIGVNTAIFSPGGGSVGIGFAVPSDMVQKVVADLADDGVIARGWLGVQIKPMSDEIANVLGFDGPKGAVIEAVGDQTPAQKAGLRKDDIILSFNGTEIAKMQDLPRLVADDAPDSVASLVVLRKGAEVTLEVTLGTLPDPAA
jgi:serine protease Do